MGASSGQGFREYKRYKRQKRPPFVVKSTKVVNILPKLLDKHRILVYIYCVPHSTVTIRVRKETRARLHAVKNPGQSLDGIITQMIDLWEKQKKQETAGATAREK